MLYIILVVLLVGLFYFYVKKKHSYWSDRGVAYSQPRFFVGHFDIFQRKSWTENIKDYYDSVGDQRYLGFYMFTMPFLLVKDLELVQRIMVKEFDHFTDRRTVSSDDIDPFWSRNLVNARGERWRELRNILSPSFTGSKMRLMFGLMERCARNFVEHYGARGEEVVVVEVKDALTRFSTDVIATTAFGLECNSFEQPENEFFMAGKEVTDLGFFRLMRYMVFSISPTLTKLFDIKVIPPHISAYFSTLIATTIRHREQHHVRRPDMLQLLMEARAAHPASVTLDDVVAQAFLFFFAGFETGSTLLSFALYELALHPHVQSRLRAELAATPSLDHDSLHSLRYLDMVLCETLRKWPPASFTDRKVTRRWLGEEELTLEPGAGCLVPIFGIHRDPEHYPEPERFDPERFGEEERARRHPAAFIPFGVGPRFCVGNRFALQEAKLLLFHVLREFEVVLVEGSRVPVVLDERKFGVAAKGGMWLGLKKVRV